VSLSVVFVLYFSDLIFKFKLYLSLQPLTALPTNCLIDNSE